MNWNSPDHKRHVCFARFSDAVSMWFLLLVVCLSVFASEGPVVTPSLIFRVNSMQSTWRAGFNISVSILCSSVVHRAGSRVHGITGSQARSLCGVKVGGPVLPRKEFPAHPPMTLPAQFNSITNWVGDYLLFLLIDSHAVPP